VQVHISRLDQRTVLSEWQQRVFNHQRSVVRGAEQCTREVGHPPTVAPQQCEFLSLRGSYVETSAHRRRPLGGMNDKTPNGLGPKLRTCAHNPRAQVAAQRGRGACIAECIEEAHVRPVVGADQLQIVDCCCRINAIMREVAALKNYIGADRPLPIPDAGRAARRREVACGRHCKPVVVIGVGDCDLVRERSAYDRIPRLGGVLDFLQIVSIGILRSVDISAQIAGGQKHKTTTIAATVTELINGRGPRRWAAAAEAHVAGHRHADHTPPAWRSRFSQCDASSGDGAIEFGIILVVWEIAHDFLARIIGQLIGKLKPTVLQRTRPLVAPVVLLGWIALAALARPYWMSLQDRTSEAALRELGAVFRQAESGGGIAVDLFGSNDDRLIKAWPHLKRIRPLELKLPPGIFLVPFKYFTNLDDLFGGTRITSLEPLKELTNLSALDLSDATRITSLEPLKGLTNLSSLNLSGATGITSLELCCRLQPPHEPMPREIGERRLAALREKRRPRRSVQPFRHDCFHLPADLHRSVCLRLSAFAPLGPKRTSGTFDQQPRNEEEEPRHRHSSTPRPCLPRRRSSHFTAAKRTKSSGLV
jgi:hypothetical protein